MCGCVGELQCEGYDSTYEGYAVSAPGFQINQVHVYLATLFQPGTFKHR